MMDLFEIAQATGGTAFGEQMLFAGVSTDSRSITSGELFVALRGDRFDGHQYLAGACARGAAGAMVAADAVDALREQFPALPLIAVADTRLALGALAAWWRSRFSLPLLAVTGSNGKTTTKEMIAAILQADARQAGYDPAVVVLATHGNFNNDIGLPLTLLKMSGLHRAAIIEMGMNHTGEISYLTHLARPTVAVVTNAQRAHLAGMGDLAGIAAEKAEIYEGLTADGVAVINADDHFAALWRERNAGRRVLSFSLGQQPADVVGDVHQHGLETALTLRTAAGDGQIVLRIPGAHNARNAVAAAAAALAAGVPLAAVVAGLNEFAGVPGRLQRRAGIHGAVLLDDTYNANPDSVRAGIDVLAATIGRKILVLGDMGEIGDASGQYHDEIGGYAKSQGIDRLFALGEMSAVAARNFGGGSQHFSQIEKLIEALKPELGPDTTVLVKGSRFMRMERVSDAISVDGVTAKENH